MTASPLFLAITALALGGLALAGCGDAAEQPDRAETRLGAPEDAVYHGVRTRLLEEDMVNFLVTMEGARDADDVIAYARCAAAQYAVIREYGFARHVRTNVAEQGGIWQADAVYTVSPALPRGFRTIDAEVTVADCTEQGIPTV
ncbi:MAG: hypothetical protein HLUCCA12_03365 [Rhodobacteraceae bacterium HLUCCA12]|nr:MAG: hypothetical protein HLUCCA12_03365 [Rhodobacteraceae bacterium HLUCCA12]